MGKEDHTPPASDFSPTNLDTDVWVEAAASFGAKYAVLTATHRSGFALWPTASHNYSVRSSPWKAGAGDVLSDFVASCRKYNISPGVFWTQRFNFHFGVPDNGLVDPNFSFNSGTSKLSQGQYDTMMFTQLRELASYGFEEIWINGLLEHSAEGGIFTDLADELRRLFPRTVCHSCSGYSQGNHSGSNSSGGGGGGFGLRWVGNEEAEAPLPSWGAARLTDGGGGGGGGGSGSNMNGETGDTGDVGIRCKPASSGMPPPKATPDPHGGVYMPPSCDAVLREHCWFGGAAYPAGKCKLQSTSALLGRYLSSVGQSCNLILNVAPGTDGGLTDEDMEAYAGLGRAIRSISSGLAIAAESSATVAVTATVIVTVTVTIGAQEQTGNSSHSRNGS
jgi:alpha-L-fucosidase